MHRSSYEMSLIIVPILPPMTADKAMENLVPVNVVDDTDTHKDGYIWDNSVPKKLKYAIHQGSEDTHANRMEYTEIKEDTMYLVNLTLVDEFQVQLKKDVVHHLVKTKEYILHALMTDTETEYAILKDAENYYRAQVADVVKYSPAHHDLVDTTESDGGDTEEDDFSGVLKF